MPKKVRKFLFDLLMVVAAIATIIMVIPFFTGYDSAIDLYNKYVKSIKVKVDTPEDGFIALRSEPSLYDGQRIDSIPHQEIISIHNCQEKTEVDKYKISGQWCRCDYKEKDGWVFNGYLRQIN